MSILDQMFFTALDDNFDTIVLVDNYDSAIWTERYGEVGDFEIHGQLNSQLHLVADKAAYVFNAATSSLMVVEKPKTTLSEEDGGTITISGRSFESFLDRRVMLENKTIFNPLNATPTPDSRISKIICDLVSDAFCNPTTDPKLSRRYWSGLEVINSTGLTSPKLALGTGIQLSTGDNLLEVVIKLCGAYGLGFKCLFVPHTKTVQFIVYEGLNRTLQGENLLVFSELYDNLMAVSDELTSGHVKNTAVVVGNKVDPITEKPFEAVVVGDSRWMGLSRRELFLQTDQEPVVYVDANTERPMRNDEYVAALTLLATTELNNATYQNFKNFEGEIAETQRCQYGVEFALGDIIAFSMTKAQDSAARLDGITFSDDAGSGKTLAPIFTYGV